LVHLLLIGSVYFILIPKAVLIINNGWSGGFFELGRGVRQGCPLSPYIFILCVEVLATAIQRDNEIEGISVGNVECKISEFADDTTSNNDSRWLTSVA